MYTGVCFSVYLGRSMLNVHRNERRGNLANVERKERQIKAEDACYAVLKIIIRPIK